MVSRVRTPSEAREAEAKIDAWLVDDQARFDRAAQDAVRKWQDNPRQRELSLRLDDAPPAAQHD